jgi:outer membrane biosynthesis protein TonB
VIVPWIQFELAEVEKPKPLPQVIELLPDPPAPPKPKEEAPAAKEEPKPAPKDEAPKQEAAPKKDKPVEAPPVAPKPTAREIAQKSGLMQLADQLADLRDRDLISATHQQPLVSQTLSSSGGAPNADRVMATAAAGSGGIGANAQSVTSAQSGTGLGNRRTAGVQSPIGYGKGPASGDGKSGTSPAASRSLQELQLTFDRSKNAFSSIFNRAARENPAMEAGKIVVSLTIAPDGSVTRCDVVSSSFSDPDLEQKILQRVKLLNFGAKNVPPYTYPNYPLNFLPS